MRGICLEILVELFTADSADRREAVGRSAAGETRIEERRRRVIVARRDRAGATVRPDKVVGRHTRPLIADTLPEIDASLQREREPPIKVAPNVGISRPLRVVR